MVVSEPVSGSKLTKKSTHTEYIANLLEWSYNLLPNFPPTRRR